MSEHLLESNKSLLEQCQDMYGQYGRYINKWRAFPLYEDGLKLVERRVLYSEYLTARKKFTKSAEVVGYCIGKFHPHGDCLRGDTVIPFLDGTKHTMKELAEKYKDKKFWLYSCDPNTLEIVPGLGHSPRIGQITDTMYRITLDNGKVVECTGNHPFMTRWISRPRYIKACDLKVGESLRSFNLHKSPEGYYYTFFNHKDIPIHIMVGKQLYGYTKGCIYHHKDFNKENNDPSNIIKLSRKEHVDIHYKNDPEYKKLANIGLNKGRLEMFSENGKYRQEIKEKNSRLIRKYNDTYIYALDRAIIYMKWLSKNVDDVNLENYNKYRKSGGYNVPRFETLVIKGYIKDFDDLYQKSEINTKVVKIEIIKLDKPIEFYDITVDKYSNFAIDQGIFVHNSSTYQTLVQLCNCGLSDYNGNFGTSIGLHDEPSAAMRYTEVKMSEDVVDMAFQHLNFIPFEELELPNKEPVYLASKLPFCLLRKKDYCIGLGFGYRTYMPSYRSEDLVKRLNWLLTKQGDEPIIKPYTDCQLVNNDEVYKELLTTGKAKVNYRGIVEMDKASKSVIIRSISPSKRWTTLLNKFKDEIQVQKSIGYIDESCGNETRVRFTILKRGQNIEKIYKTISDIVSGDVSFCCNMCDIDGNVKIVSVDQMLLKCYDVYKNANKDMLEFNISKCKELINSLQLVEKVKKVLPKWLKEYPDDLEKLIRGVQNDTQIDLKILKEMFEKYTIPRFVKCKTDTDEIKKRMMVFEESLNKIDEFVWKLYQKIQ